MLTENNFFPNNATGVSAQPVMHYIFASWDKMKHNWWQCNIFYSFGLVLNKEEIEKTLVGNFRKEEII